ncbi:MAG: SRPBCC domain-containing protein [Cohaesibacter sp.]|nr:SRPBCC domain-containing protein [Cohaesibacter sp.]MCV6603138.1 SRPBCC domain-containing protein [Cohaesibacter sp.]
MIKPIVKAAQLPLTQEAAYCLFVEKMALWWPLHTRSVSAHLTGERALGLEVDAVAGGKITEIAADGTRYIWGSFKDCDAPHSVAIAFHMGQPAEGASNLVVSFLPLGDEECRVKLHHSGWESYGELAQMMRDGYETAWGEIFDQGYVEACLAQN